jgi:EmrB/QacA subfamily drug resistance transporter
VSQDHVDSEQLGRRRFWTIFGAVLVCMLLASLDQTIVGTALPSIAAQLGGMAQLTWVVTAYLLAVTATTPLWGKFGDLYGHRVVMSVAIVVFLAGSALCGVAWDMPSLIAFRALQGIGAGGLIVLAMAVIALIVSPRERGRYQGYIQAVFTLSSVSGPLIGGLFVDYASWRWVFYVNLPLGVLAVFVIASMLPRSDRRTQHRLDWLGASLLVTAICSLLLITEWGGREFSWESVEIAGLAVVFVAALGGFLLQERRHPEPIVPLGLFRNPVVRVTVVVLLAATACFFAASVFLPVYLQTVRGLAAAESGLLLLPMLLAITITTAVCGRLVSKTGRYKVFPVAGMAFVVLAMFLFSTLGADSNPLLASLYMVVMGVGFGAVGQVMIVAVQNVVPREQLGVTTATANLFRSLGGSIGVAVFGVVFAAGVAGRSGATATASGSHWVFLAALPLAVLGFVATLFLREVPLRGGPVATDKKERVNG